MNSHEIEPAPFDMRNAIIRHRIAAEIPMQAQRAATATAFVIFLRADVLFMGDLRASSKTPEV